MKSLLLILTILVAGCVSPQTPKEVQISRELGRHDLPFQPNERFILESIVQESGAWTSGPTTIFYYLDGRRRKMLLSGKGSTDGYITDMGRLLANEIEGVESPIMDERVIQIASGEEITIAGNTIDQGIRLRAGKPEEVGVHPDLNDLRNYYQPPGDKTALIADTRPAGIIFPVTKMPHCPCCI